MCDNVSRETTAGSAFEGVSTSTNAKHADVAIKMFKYFFPRGLASPEDQITPLPFLVASNGHRIDTSEKAVVSDGEPLLVCVAPALCMAYVLMQVCISSSECMNAWSAAADHAKTVSE